MRIGGGVPGTGHSVLRPGAATSDCWVWDAQGEADIDDVIGRVVLELAGRSGLHEVGAATACTSDGASPEDGNEDMRPLAHYTFDMPAEDNTQARRSTEAEEKSATKPTAAKADAPPKKPVRKRKR